VKAGGPIWTRDDVELTVEHNVVSIRAQRRPAHEEGDEVVVDERPHGTFTRQLFLGDNLDASKLSADYDRGVLMLMIPIAEASKPRHIDLGAHREELPDTGAATPDQGSNKQQGTTS
jgi:HSP20 family protein